MTIVQISERIGNFLLAAIALPFGLAGLSLIIHVAERIL
jgi:hypothetical protein